MGSAQGLNAAWLTSRMEEHKRPIALAAYVMSIQLAGFPGNQLFRAQGRHKSHSFRVSRSSSFRCSTLSAWTHSRRLLYHLCSCCGMDLEAALSHRGQEDRGNRVRRGDRKPRDGRRCIEGVAIRGQL